MMGRARFISRPPLLLHDRFAHCDACRFKPQETYLLAQLTSEVPAINRCACTATCNPAMHRVVALRVQSDVEACSAGCPCCARPCREEEEQNQADDTQLPPDRHACDEHMHGKTAAGAMTRPKRPRLVPRKIDPTGGIFRFLNRRVAVRTAASKDREGCLASNFFPELLPITPLPPSHGHVDSHPLSLAAAPSDPNRGHRKIDLESVGGGRGGTRAM